MRRPTARRVLLLQAGYYVVTGVAPFVSRRAFERVTGPKADWWLVETVGATVATVGVGVWRAVRNQRETPELAGIAAGCAAGLAAVDVRYVLQGRISPVYLADAAVELGFIAGTRELLLRPAADPVR